MVLGLAHDFGERLRALRERLGETQQAFAVRWLRTARQISQWETGKQAPHLSQVARVAEKEGWPLDIFLESGPMPGDVWLEESTHQLAELQGSARVRRGIADGSAGAMEEEALELLLDAQLLLQRATSLLMASQRRAAINPSEAEGGASARETFERAAELRRTQEAPEREPSTEDQGQKPA